MAGSDGNSPLEQFQIKQLLPVEVAPGVNVDFTNASLYMVITVALITLVFTLSMKKRALVPSRWQSIAELSYEFVANMIKQNVGVEGRRFFPLVFSLFMFVLFSNLIGMIPGAFTTTSHIAVTFGLAAFIFLMVTCVAIYRHGFIKFCGFFLPHGTPAVMAPIMIFIELFSYLARPVSLSVRLAANMMAGHTMLKVLAGFVISLGVTLGWAPLAFLVVLTGFEIFVAILQAYIFTVLTCVYLNDAVHLH